ncbi:hypothetical protein L1887_53005 [Cichorium endivia]|nr:hypothetical protein L1887_53005 [Cichorium endivia]
MPLLTLQIHSLACSSSSQHRPVAMSIFCVDHAMMMIALNAREERHHRWMDLHPVRETVGSDAMLQLCGDMQASCVTFRAGAMYARRPHCPNPVGAAAPTTARSPPHGGGAVPVGSTGCSGTTPPVGAASGPGMWASLIGSCEEMECIRPARFETTSDKPCAAMSVNGSDWPAWR